MFNWLKIPVRISKGAETRLLEKASETGATAESIVTAIIEKGVSREWDRRRERSRRHIRKLRKR